MNNSLARAKLDLNATTPQERESDREAKLIRMIEALKGLEKNLDWQLMKAEVWDGLTDRLERRLKNECKSKELNLPEIYRLQGELDWAARYSDLDSLAREYKVELENIKLRKNAN